MKIIDKLNLKYVSRVLGASDDKLILKRIIDHL
jgi:hypothetical protein